MADAFALYTYFRSSASFRVRIALNLKGIEPEFRFVHLLREGGRQHSGEYSRLNPQEIVPTLVHGSHVLGQSLAIIEYLDEIHPQPPLLPRDAWARARVRQLAYATACEIQPLNNLRVQNYLRDAIGADHSAIGNWQGHWMELGFRGLEALLANSPETGRFCHGAAPTLADICLVPQLANARRARLNLDSYPTLTRIEAECLDLKAFADAQPARQPDAE